MTRRPREIIQRNSNANAQPLEIRFHGEALVCELGRHRVAVRVERNSKCADGAATNCLQPTTASVGLCYHPTATFESRWRRPLLRSMGCVSSVNTTRFSECVISPSLESVYDALGQSG